MNPFSMSPDKDRRGGKRRDVCMFEAAVSREPGDRSVGEFAPRQADQTPDLDWARLDPHRRFGRGSSSARSVSSPITHNFGPARTFDRNGSSLRNRALHSRTVITCSLTERPSPRSTLTKSPRTTRVDSAPRTMRSMSLVAVAEPDANDPKTNARSTPRPLSAGRRLVAGPRSLRTIDDTSSKIADRGSAEYTRRPPAVLALTNPAALRRFSCRWTAAIGSLVARASSVWYMARPRSMKSAVRTLARASERTSPCSASTTTDCSLPTTKCGRGVSA